MPTAPIQARIDPRDLATLLSYYSSRNIRIKNKSDLVRRAIEDYVQFVCMESEMPTFHKVDAAINYLESQGISFGRRTKRTIQIALEEENRVEEERPTHVVNPIAVDEAVRMMKEEDNGRSD